MKILIVGDYPFDEHESMRRFAELLERELKARGEDVRLVSPQPWFGRRKSKSRGIGEYLGHFGYIDKYVLFPPVLRREAAWADVVHICGQEYAVYAKYLRDVPHLVSCQDMIGFRVALGDIAEGRSRWRSRLRYRFLLKWLKRVEKAVCVSESTKVDFLRLTMLDPGSVLVVRNGLNYDYRPMARAPAAERLARLGVPADVPFFMHVGNNSFYKNRIGVIKIFTAIREIVGNETYSLVMVGKPFTEEMRDALGQDGVGARVFEFVGIGNEDLRALYSLSCGLIFPSLYEGLGWPPMEAQACGCPVFASDRAPLREACGEGARYFEPTDPAGAARLILESLGGVEEMCQAGFANVGRFTTSAMIEGYLRVYETMIAERKAAS